MLPLSAVEDVDDGRLRMLLEVGGHMHRGGGEGLFGRVVVSISRTRGGSSA